jgi:hypothetical protein
MAAAVAAVVVQGWPMMPAMPSVVRNTAAIQVQISESTAKYIKKKASSPHMWEHVRWILVS